MEYQASDLYKEYERHCFDCKEDVTATLLPKSEGMKVEPGEEHQMNVSIPVGYQCPKCKGFNVGGVSIEITIDKEGNLL